VLYVTYEPVWCYKYTPRKAIFQEITDEAGWETVVCSGSYDDLTEKIKINEFAKGYDAVIYNFCLAPAKNTEACSNTIGQTRDQGYVLC
jgi:hypothetical protein